jgi:hypothetical protein
MLVHGLITEQLGALICARLVTIALNWLGLGGEVGGPSLGSG